jgi:hypothetical protein
MALPARRRNFRCPFAAWDFTFGLTLTVAYYRLGLAEVRGKP